MYVSTPSRRRYGVNIAVFLGQPLRLYLHPPFHELDNLRAMFV
jgi:hypothetical protein